MLAESGALEIFIGAGARILECGCGPCIGIGQAVRTGGSSLRTINRNFKGRCGTKDSYVYISSPETAAASAVTGRLTAASELMDVSGLLKITEPERYPVDDSLIIAPEEGNRDTEIYYGPNIKPIPVLAPLPDSLSVKIAGKYGDNISTDDISPAGQKNVGNRANVPLVSESTFERMDPDFCRRAREYQSSIIVAGENYGQGSSREHAALQPMYLGVKAVLAKSFARIHKANLVNFGLLPMSFENPDDYEKMDEGDELELSDLKESLKAGRIAIQNRSKNMVIYGNISLSKREKEVILAGGRLPYIRQRKG
jgi:aconitate hydratase